MLKTATVSVAGEEFEITEPNAAAQIEILEASRQYGDEIPETANLRFAAIMCAHCVKGIGSQDEALNNYPLSVLLELAEKITSLSGSDAAKNSESAPSDDSSSA